MTAYISDCDIGTSYCSDHSPIHLDISFDSIKNKGRFIFPVDLCYSMEFCSKLEENWKGVLSNNSDTKPDTLWDHFKCTVNSSAISFKSFQKKIHKELVESFESKIATTTHLQDLEPSLLMKANYQEQIVCLNKDLDNLFAEKRKEVHARNLARWFSLKGLTTSYFLNRFKKDKDKAIVSQLISGSGLITENRDILAEAHNYYSGLYKKDQCCPPFPETDEVPFMCDFDSSSLAAPITMDELYLALKSMKQASAPGIDGLTVKFYLHFWDLVKEPLLASYNFSYSSGRLAVSQRRGLIKLLPKKNRNLLFIDHWWPISLLNVDYKILSKLFAKRMKNILPYLIHPDQRGFITNCHASNGILDLYAILDLITEEKDEYLLCTIDIQKAFDSVDGGFLNYVLTLFGFPPEFIKWFNVFYTDHTAHVMNNNEWSEKINIEKGNFQGCPLSPLLFVLAIEILASRIRGNEEIQGIKVTEEFSKKLNLVADDLLLVFKNTISRCEQVKEELKEFSRNSGLKINKDKSSVSVVGSDCSLEVDRLPLFQRKPRQIDYIGFTFHPRSELLWKDNMSSKIDLMVRELRSTYGLSQCTVLERITVIKSLFFSRLPYFVEKLPFPDEQVIKNLQANLTDIIWVGKKPKMKLENSVAPVSEGAWEPYMFRTGLKLWRSILLH